MVPVCRPGAGWMEAARPSGASQTSPCTTSAACCRASWPHDAAGSSTRLTSGEPTVPAAPHHQQRRFPGHFGARMSAGPQHRPEGPAKSRRCDTQLHPFGTISETAAARGHAQRAAGAPVTGAARFFAAGTRRAPTRSLSFTTSKIHTMVELTATQATLVSWPSSCPAVKIRCTPCSRPAPALAARFPAVIDFPGYTPPSSPSSSPSWPAKPGSA